jgi:hypothetical protein
VRLLAVAKDEPWAMPTVWPGVELDDAMDFVQRRAVNERAEVAVLRDPAVAVDARLSVAVDGQVKVRDWLWDGASGRSGFGGLFGEGGFGMDVATGPGLGGGGGRGGGGGGESNRRNLREQEAACEISLGHVSSKICIGDSRKQYNCATDVVVRQVRHRGHAFVDFGNLLHYTIQHGH